MTQSAWEVIFGNYAQTIGLTTGGFNLIFAIMFSIGVAIFLIGYTKNKNVGIVSFFMTLGMFAFLNFINWLFFLLPLILVAIIYIYLGDKE